MSIQTFTTDPAAFKGRMEETVYKLMDQMETSKGYTDNFNLHITLDGHTLSLELNADLYEQLCKLVTYVIEDKEENKK